MDSMLSAIRARRNGGQASGMLDQAQMEQPQPEQKGEMKGLVDALSPEQREELLMLLSQSAQQGNEIAQGGPSSDEKAEIAAKAGQQPAEQGAEEIGEGSDEIAMSMLDRNSLEKAEAGVKPRGLGDRAKMYAAKKLKGKGKI